MIKHNISINNDLYVEIKQYCELNKIKINDLCYDLLKKGLNNLKYGNIPFGIVEQCVNGPVEVQYNEPIDAYIEPISSENVPVIQVEKDNENNKIIVNKKKVRKLK